MENNFSSFPEMVIPKILHTSCDVINERKQFRIKMNIPRIKKKEELS